MSAFNWLAWLYLVAMALGCVLGLGALLGGDGDVGDGDAGDGDETQTDVGADGHADASGASAWWSALGVGRVPLGLLVSLDLLLFGACGVIGSEILGVLLSPALAGLVALPFAAVAGPALGARLALAVARRLPAVESYGTSRDGLVGRFARAELEIDESFGRARVTDDGGAAHLVRCRTSRGTATRGSTVLITDCDPRTGIYLVEPAASLFAEADEGAPARRAAHRSSVRARH